ncbi:MAG: bifunctional ornithine acetyltransferase/N-acetylglutamate synthase [Candidatus Rokubacteria bacterium 13_1_20CM_2_68_19]|nr:MAG: bifunctional ornithine acetyltransferase/N-acetylglutamate synthase [Candidatus Rokubacteria bacterium 13_1_40CM_4_67_11]OLD30564.1 MAG: bifunctional ornithine acetyltransferase/N-acetylglutamate synthase [Candidatus Rokubacteria bacterium 13_1_40CM_2_68_13]OLD95815.1 MAG: bifunctional ornithine acetyltransferase/N-acetylglutamate synthase [Candidatus Rokubacteria bacterium 13_1_20CM_4_68_9]OLE42992.1 MAG: bifunctional ornithine acetyltransferase/N-acetylglutamate synthase [Candidatus Ro
MPEARATEPKPGDLEWLTGGVTAVPEILASGIAAGIKPSGKKDLALLYSSSPARAAAVFTSNQVKGAPVLVSQEHVKSGVAQAIVASSGCSNVCTGEQGMRDAREMTKVVGDLLRIPARQVLIASTGVIGQPLPMDRIRAALPKLVKALSPQGGHAAAEAIMTTDTRPKEAAVKVEVNGRPITIGGIAKGVGMIEPHLATMFCFLTTDAAVAPAALRSALKRSVDDSFNRITVDSDQSTSDTVAILANGLAETAPLDAGSRGFRQFTRALGAVTTRLARMLVEDGEGATRLVTVAVRGARTRRDAVVVARSVANSPLVKTAINGQDPNWGRIMMAIGKSPARVEADKIAVAFEDELLVERGMLRDGAKHERIRETMTRPAYTITIDLGLGRGEAHVFTCDLSEEYVRINAKYTT